MSELRPATPAARAVLAHRDFRTMFVGSFASNIGTWMQNVILGAYVYDVTKSPTWVSLIQLAQLGPMLLLSLVGGALADRVDRRRLLLSMEALQVVTALLLTVIVARGHGAADRWPLLGVVLVGGIFQALTGPAMQAFVPLLVPRPLIGGAIALNSAQMNAARVIGPAIAGLLLSVFGTAVVFGVNAATYGFVIAAIWVIRPTPAAGAAARPERQPVLRQFGEGALVLRRDTYVRRVLTTVFLFSLLCLPFIGQMPTIAAENLGIEPRSLAYALLYAGFGVGAVIGAASIATFLAHADRSRLLTTTLTTFALALGALAVVHQAPVAYPIVAIVGFSYFASVTVLNSSLQEYLDDAIRGRVMAIWLMAFGGTVPIGLMLAGPVAEHWSISAVLASGAAAALLLAGYAASGRLDQPGRLAPVAPGRHDLASPLTEPGGPDVVPGLVPDRP